MRFKLLIILNLLGFSIFAQQVGTEQVVTKSIYKGDFKVEGDKDTYYPVVFKSGNQNLINHLKIYRSYNEPGPNELNPTHKGALLLEIDVNYGGWGGQTYDWKIAAHQEAYHPTFADAAIGMFSQGFMVWLRGGGFLYNYESEKPANLQIAYALVFWLQKNGYFITVIGRSKVFRTGGQDVDIEGPGQEVIKLTGKDRSDEQKGEGRLITFYSGIST